MKWIDAMNQVGSSLGPPLEKQLKEGLAATPTGRRLRRILTEHYSPPMVKRVCGVDIRLPSGKMVL